MKRTLLTCFCLMLFATPALAQDRRPMQIADLFRAKRISDPQISPDGSLVVYAQTDVDVDANTRNSDLWIVSADGGEPRRLTNTPQGESHPRFSPDGKSILFSSSRSGSMQLYVLPIDGGEARQLTDISTGASNGMWSPDGSRIAFVSAVAPEFSELPFAQSDAQNKAKAQAAENNPIKARVFDKLFFRHWDSWVEGARQHLFVVSAAGGEPRDVTPGDWDAYPTSMTFSVGDDFTFSPDGEYVVFTAPPRQNEAWSTNHGIWRVPVGGGEPENLTANNLAADSAPRYSPDGKLLAYRAQGTAGFEAAQWELMVVPCDAGGKPQGTPRSVTDDFDNNADDCVWNATSDTLYFTSDVNAHHPILRISATQPNAAVEEVYGVHSSGSLSISENKRLAFTNVSLNRPSEVFVLSAEFGAKQITHANDELFAQIAMNEPESVTVAGSGGTPMQMWLIKPPGFNENRKWPLVYLVHGGPQGSWGDGWSYRWNPQVWAAQGYVVACPNPRGSTGFGQQYTDEITGDWGGKVFEDLMAGMDWLEEQPYIDTDRMAAAGASYGGYMMNWFQGHTDRFKTLITHCGVYNFDSMYATEELWFIEWENGGTPWGENREAMYEKFSPHRYAANFQTPNLIIHNDLDFRVPMSEGLQLFTTLQRKGIPSKMINFPDEGHWVNKPANSRYWHQEVFAWLEAYAPAGGR